MNRRGTPGTNPLAHGEMTSAAPESLRMLGRSATSASCASSMLEAGQVRRAGNGDGPQVLWEVAR